MWGITLIGLFYITTYAAAATTECNFHPNCICQFNRNNNGTVRIVCEKINDLQRNTLYHGTQPRIELGHVVLSRNNITVLSEGFFQNVTGIDHLDVSHNSMASFASLDIRVEYLDLSNNEFISLFGVLVGRWSPEKLNLGKNQISDISLVEMIPDLSSLDLSYNNLTSIPDHSFEFTENLRYLNASNNHINQVFGESFAFLNNVRYFDVSHNNISTLPDFVFVSMVRLVKLNLSYNRLERLSQSQLLISSANFSEIDLSHNSLIHLDGQSFVTMTALKTIGISGNIHLGSAVNTLQLPSSLSHLDASFCGLGSITNCEWRNMNLETLNLDGNPLDCGCEMAWVWYWYRALLPNNPLAESFKSWQCMKDTSVPMISVNIDPYSCSNKSSSCPVLYPDLFINLTVSIHKNDAVVGWNIENAGNATRQRIFGYRLNASTLIDYTPMLHKYATNYTYMKLDDFKTHTFCLHVYKNPQTVWSVKCVSGYVNSMRIITGVVAAIVFVVPCAIILGVILCKDRQQQTRLREKQALKDADVLSRATGDEPVILGIQPRSSSSGPAAGLSVGKGVQYTDQNGGQYVAN